MPRKSKTERQLDVELIDAIERDIALAREIIADDAKRRPERYRVNLRRTYGILLNASSHVMTLRGSPHAK